MTCSHLFWAEFMVGYLVGARKCSKHWQNYNCRQSETWSVTSTNCLNLKHYFFLIVKKWRMSLWTCLQSPHHIEPLLVRSAFFLHVLCPVCCSVCMPCCVASAGSHMLNVSWWCTLGWFILCCHGSALDYTAGVHPPSAHQLYQCLRRYVTYKLDLISPAPTSVQVHCNTWDICK